MKSVKKRIGILLLAALVLVAFAACNRDSAGSAGGQGSAARISWPGPAPQNLGGMVFRFADFHDDRFFPSEGQIGTPVGDMKAMVMKSIEDDFNIKFELVSVPPGETINRLYPAVWAGDQFANMIITTQWAYGSLIGAGLMGDLSKVSTLNLNDGLWVQAVHRATTINNEVLATAGIFEHWDNTWVTYFQKSLWKELNLPDPYELVRRGEWTWEKVQEFAIIAAQDLNGDGVIEGPNDRWGLVSPGDDLLRAWYTSMGGLYWDFNPTTGRLFSPAATPDGIAIADWMRNFTEVPGGWYRAGGQTDELRNEMFVNRRALFSMGGLGVPGAFREMYDDFGILPMPKRNAQQRTYLNNVNHNAPLIGISITNNQQRETGIIMEAMAARFAQVRELQRAELVDILLRSDEDVEMLDYILPYTVFDMGHIMFRAESGFNIPHARLTDYVTAHAIGDFASVMEANRDAMELSANEFFAGKEEEAYVVPANTPRVLQLNNIGEIVARETNNAQFGIEQNPPGGGGPVYFISNAKVTNDVRMEIQFVLNNPVDARPYNYLVYEMMGDTFEVMNNINEHYPRFRNDDTFVQYQGSGAYRGAIDSQLGGASQKWITVTISLAPFNIHENRDNFTAAMSNMNNFLLRFIAANPDSIPGRIYFRNLRLQMDEP
jgi:hypothetical protein